MVDANRRPTIVELPRESISECLNIIGKSENSVCDTKWMRTKNINKKDLFEMRDWKYDDM